MLKVGLTGGLGSGKSTATKTFADMGAYIFDADGEAKKLIEKNETVQNELIAEFGTDIMNAQGGVDKRKLARVAFQDDIHQQNLNAVVHPYIFELIDSKFQKVSVENIHTLFIVDGAMIYESGYDIHLDYVIVITAQLMHRMERALKRGGLSREDILKRVEFQLPEEEKVNMADFVIHNDTSESDLEEAVIALYKKLT